MINICVEANLKMKPSVHLEQLQLIDLGSSALAGNITMSLLLSYDAIRSISDDEDDGVLNSR